MDTRKLKEKRDVKHRVVIESNGINQTSMSIDGIDVSDIVTEIRFVHKGAAPPALTMEIRGCDVTVKTPQVPRLPEVFDGFYIPVD